jgi:hypothetical protein
MLCIHCIGCGEHVHGLQNRGGGVASPKKTNMPVVNNDHYIGVVFPMQPSYCFVGRASGKAWGGARLPSRLETA